jgi:hypothetical protein
MPKKAKSAGSRKTPRQKNELTTFTFPDSPDGSQEFTSLVMAVRASETLKGVLELLDLTLEHFGDLLSDTPQLKRTQTHVSKPYASMLCAGKRFVSPRMLKAIEVVIGQQLTEIAGEPIGLHITKNSPWHFAVGKTCAKHGPYEIDGRRRHCPKCQEA